MVMLMIDAKEYLQHIELIDTRIQNKLDEQAHMRSIALSITSSLRPDPVSSGGVHDKIGDAMAKVVDLEAEIDREIDRLIDTKQDIKTLLDGVKNPSQLRVLHLRYFGFYDKTECRQRYPSFAEIGYMMGYSERQVCNIHGIALLRVNELLRERAGV
jgi:hypothetical protein